MRFALFVLRGNYAMSTETVEVLINDRDMYGSSRRLKQVLAELEKQGKAILGLRVPGWAASNLGFTPDPVVKNGYQYGDYQAVQEQTYPSNIVTIEFS